MNPLLLRFLPHIAALLAVAALLFGIHHHGYNQGEQYVQAKWDADKVQQAEAQRQKNLADTERLAKLNEEKRDAEITIDEYRASVAKLDRLRLPASACRKPSKAGADKSTADGQLRGDVQEGEGSLEDALNKFADTFGSEAIRAEVIVKDCRVLNEFGR